MTLFNLMVLLFLASIVSSNAADPMIEWMDLFSNKSVTSHESEMQDRLAEMYFHQDHPFEWPQTRKLIHGIIERDALIAWLEYYQKEDLQRVVDGVDDEPKAPYSVFGTSELSALKNDDDKQCIANLFHSSRQLSEDQLCDHKNYENFKNFIDCWTYKVRTTVNGQYLQWRMMKNVEHCFGLVEKDTPLLQDLYASIVAKDIEDLSDINNMLSRSVDPNVKSSLDHVKLVMDRRLTDALGIIEAKMKNYA